jgi:type I restriction enzyme S subunit
MKSIALPEVAKIIMGQSPPSSSYNTKGEGLPFFQGKADFGDLYPTVRIFCTEPNKVAEAGDILISVRAPVGPTNISPTKCCIGRGLAAIRCSRAVELKYLLYFLRFYEPELVRAGSGSTFDAISRDDLENLQVPLLPVPEQQRIVAILAKADRLRRLRRAARELSDTYLQSVFLEMFGDPIANPMGWEKIRLGSLCQIIRGASPRPIKYFLGGTVPWIKIGDGTQGDDLYIASTEDHITEAAVRKSVFLKAGSLIFANCGVSLGFARILKIDGCIHDGWLAFNKLDETRMHPFFLLKTLNQITPYLRSLAPIGTQPNLNTGIMNGLPLILPPLALQHQFAAIVRQFERLRAQQREAERQAEHLFQTLLHRAFRGEL